MIRVLMVLFVVTGLTILSPVNDSHDVLGRLRAAGQAVQPKLDGNAVAAAALASLARNNLPAGIEAAREVDWKPEPVRVSALRPTLPPLPPVHPAAPSR